MSRTFAVGHENPTSKKLAIFLLPSPAALTYVPTQARGIFAHMEDWEKVILVVSVGCVFHIMYYPPWVSLRAQMYRALDSTALSPRLLTRSGEGRTILTFVCAPRNFLLVSEACVTCKCIRNAKSKSCQTNQPSSEQSRCRPVFALASPGTSGTILCRPQHRGRSFPISVARRSWTGSWRRFPSDQGGASKSRTSGCWRISVRSFDYHYEVSFSYMRTGFIRGAYRSLFRAKWHFLPYMSRWVFSVVIESTRFLLL